MQHANIKNVNHGFVDDDLQWYEDKNPKGFTALIWPAKSFLKPWKVNVSWTSTGFPLRVKHFETFEAARSYCLRVTNNMAA